MNTATKLLAALSIPLLGWNGYLATKLPDKSTPAPVESSGKLVDLEDQVNALKDQLAGIGKPNSPQTHTLKEADLATRAQIGQLQGQINTFKEQITALAKDGAPINLAQFEKRLAGLEASIRRHTTDTHLHNRDKP